MSQVGNWIGERTTTIGSGIIALNGAIQGFTSFSEYGDGEYWYSILDGFNREAGKGFYSNGLFTRTNIHATIFNGFFNSSNPTAIELSGNAQIYSSFNKEAFDLKVDEAPSDGQEYVRINGAWQTATGSTGGETNTASNIVADSDGPENIRGLYASKTLANLNFKSLQAGEGIVLTSNDDKIFIDTVDSTGLADHINDLVGAHLASAIGFNPSGTGSIVTTVQNSLFELYLGKEDDLGNPSLNGLALVSTIAGVRSWAKALMDSEIASLSGIKTVVLPDNTTITSHGKDLIGAVAAANSRAVLGLGNSSILDIGTTNGTVAAGDDARFGSVDIGDLDAASTPDGAELLPASQASNPVSVTVQQIAGNPTTLARGHNGLRKKGYSHFASIGPGTTGTHNALLGNELMVSYIYNGGSVASSVGSTFSPSIALATGTTTNGAAVVLQSDYPASLYYGDLNFDMRMSLQLPALPDSGQNFTFHVGFTNGALTDFAAITDKGIYFELTDASPNWFLCVKNGAPVTKVDSGVAAVAATKVTLRVAHDQALAKSRFWINGVEQSSILDSTRAIDAFTLLGMMAGIWKTAGTTARSAILFAYAYECSTTAIPGF